MKARTPLFIILAIISVSLVPWVHHWIIKLGFAFYKVSYPFVAVCLFGPLILTVGIIQCVGSKEDSGGFRSGMWYMVIGTILITYALSFAFYGVTLK